VISVTALGEVTDRGPLTRSGGRPGDKLLVTGALGGSLAGHHLDFTPRVREALLLNGQFDLHAGMDISDGLALDLQRLATESGCGAVVRTDQIPISAAALAMPSPLQHALGDGEDFELLLAAPPKVAETIVRTQPLACPITCIGELIHEPGLWQQGPEGRRLPLTPSGWQH
jgi:thiamine-monophosphate kinase